MKKIVITCGSNGIGFECVKKFYSNGYLAFILDNKEPFSKFDDNVIYYNCDVGNYDRTLECAVDITNKFGNIDILINCAGI